MGVGWGAEDATYSKINDLRVYICICPYVFVQWRKLTCANVTQRFECATYRFAPLEVHKVQKCVFVLFLEHSQKITIFALGFGGVN